MTDNWIFRYAGIMPKTDKDIGAIVAALRGQTSQQNLAAKMTRQGFKWTQGTVSSVEKGERSLKLTEGAALAEVLGTDVRSLVGEEQAALAEQAYDVASSAIHWATRDLQEATRVMVAGRHNLIRFGEVLSIDASDLAGDAHRSLLGQDPVSVVEEEKNRVETDMSDTQADGILLPYTGRRKPRML